MPQTEYPELRTLQANLKEVKAEVVSLKKQIVSLSQLVYILRDRSNTLMNARDNLKDSTLCSICSARSKPEAIDSQGDGEGSGKVSDHDEVIVDGLYQENGQSRAEETISSCFQTNLDPLNKVKATLEAGNLEHEVKPTPFQITSPFTVDGEGSYARSDRSIPKNFSSSSLCDLYDDPREPNQVTILKKVNEARRIHEQNRQADQSGSGTQNDVGCTTSVSQNPWSKSGGNGGDALFASSPLSYPFRRLG